jgi:hypothetical protein
MNHGDLTKKLFKKGKDIYTFGQKGSNPHHYINHITGPTSILPKIQPRLFFLDLSKYKYELLEKTSL